MRRISIRCHSGTVVGWLIVVVLVVALFAYVITRPISKPDDRVGQIAQFHGIEAALELFDSQFSGYPPSDEIDVSGSPYCGAMKLAEAMMGQDVMGFHPKSAFRADGLDPNTLTPLYASQTLHARPNGGFLPLENANAYRLVDIYGKGKTGPFPEEAVILCDAFQHKLPNGRKAGMPILYYRANPSGTKHDGENPDDPLSIYNYRDNLALIALGVPGDPNAVHSLADPRRFYLNTQNTRINMMQRPYRSDSFLLISAGHDGLYGTADDVCNFEWRHREGDDAGRRPK